VLCSVAVRSDCCIDPVRSFSGKQCPKVIISIITLWFVFWWQKKDRGDLQDETRREQPSLPLTVYLEASLRTYQQI
jgi:hypothetical protein